MDKPVVTGLGKGGGGMGAPLKCECRRCCERARDCLFSMVVEIAEGIAPFLQARRQQRYGMVSTSASSGRLTRAPQSVDPFKQPVENLHAILLSRLSHAEERKGVADNDNQFREGVIKLLNMFRARRGIRFVNGTGYWGDQAPRQRLLDLERSLSRMIGCSVDAEIERAEDLYQSLNSVYFNPGK